MQPCNKNHCWASWIINKAKERVCSASASGRSRLNFKINYLFYSLQFRDVDKCRRIQRTKKMMLKCGNTGFPPIWPDKEIEHRLDHILKWYLWPVGFVLFFTSASCKVLPLISELTAPSQFFCSTYPLLDHRQMIHRCWTPTKLNGLKHPNGLIIHLLGITGLRINLHWSWQDRAKNARSHWF